MSAQNQECGFCALARGDPKQCFTDWFFLGEGLIVLEDLESKGHKMRLLVVCEEHVHCSSVQPELMRKMKRYGPAVAKAIALSRSLKVTGCDDREHSFKNHFHIQYALD